MTETNSAVARRLIKNKRQQLTMKQCRLYGRDIQEGAAEKNKCSTNNDLAAAAGPCVSFQTRQVATKLLHSLQHVSVRPIATTWTKMTHFIES